MALTGLRQGAQHLTQTSRRGGGFTPFLRWKDGDAKTILFTTPFDQIAKVRLHEYVKIPDDSREKGFRYEHFMCRKDPAWLEESGGECYLCDVMGHVAKEKHTAIAVELEAVTAPGTTAVTELRVRTRPYTREDGTTVEYPQWGLVSQGFRNFFNYFVAFAKKFGEINNTAFDITRMGNDTTTSYPIMAVPSPAPDVSGFEIPTLVEVLENIGSREHYDQQLKDSGAENLDQGFDGGEGPVETGTVMRTKFEELKESLPGGLSDKIESYS